MSAQDVSTSNSLTDLAAIRPIAEIVVGSRHRRELGDIAGLAASIADVGGLLHPIVITPHNELIAGERRHNDRWDCHGDEAPSIDGVEIGFRQDDTQALAAAEVAS
jgi:hypothetical protein